MRRIAGLLVLVVGGGLLAFLTGGPTGPFGGDTTPAPTQTPTQPATRTPTPAPTSLPTELAEPVGTVRERSFPPAPATPTGPLAPDVQDRLDEIVDGFGSFIPVDSIMALADIDDPRVLWPLSDLLRFTQERPEGTTVLLVARELTGVEIDREGGSTWRRLTDHLIAWDLPAPPGYADFKRGMYTQLESGWEPLFGDPDARIDWRFVSYGGVLMDVRPFGDPDPCEVRCLPALEEPAVTGAAGGGWYEDDGLVFAVDVDGVPRAYPKHIMESHEVVNDVVGGRRVGVVYCTLCASAQAFVTDDVAGTSDPLVLRTSGLLQRSNKLLFDLETRSFFDMFSGTVIAGPLRERGVELDRVTVVTTTWGRWKQAHPDTTIVAEDGGIGRTYDRDPLNGRDDDGPVFPIGDVDPRLPVQQLVVGVTTPDGSTVAFPAGEARSALAAGEEVAAAGVVLRDDGGGLRAELADGTPVAAHEAFWFAWSQFHPQTEVWRR